MGNGYPGRLRVPRTVTGVAPDTRVPYPGSEMEMSTRWRASGKGLRNYDFRDSDPRGTTTKDGTRRPGKVKSTKRKGGERAENANGHIYADQYKQ